MDFYSRTLLAETKAKINRRGGGKGALLLLSLKLRVVIVRTQGLKMAYERHNTPRAASDATRNAACARRRGARAR
jgi:hypothetical protein|tara:strand:- start:33897 stop:34121 length:225 start_codon:yes stop_codon:yes gene_type:complete